MPLPQIEYSAKVRVEGQRKTTLRVQIPSRQLRAIVNWGWTDVVVELHASAGTSASYRAGSYTTRIRVNCQGKGCLTVLQEIAEKLRLGEGTEVRVVVRPVPTDLPRL